MQNFTQFNEQMSTMDAAKAKLKKMKKGSQVSFTDQKSGKKVTGEYRGLKRMGGRSYAHVEHEKGATYAPVHHIHQAQ